MYLLSKFKIATIFMMCLSIPFSNYLLANDEQVIAKPTEDKKSKNLTNPDIDAMTVSALRYIAQKQSSVGSWDDTQYKGNAGVTALCCLAFMSEGSRPRVGKYGANLERGLNFLIGTVEENGAIVGKESNPLGAMNEHVLSSMALLLSYKDMPWNPRIRDILRESIQLLMKAQKMDGGWGYDFGREGHSNLAMTANVLWLLKTSNKSGFTISEKEFGKARDFSVKCAYPDGSFRFRHFGLTNQSMNGPGIIALIGNKKLLFDPSLKTQDINWSILENIGHKFHPLVGPAKDRIIEDYNFTTIEDFKKRPQFIKDCFYESIGMYAIGDENWSPWFKKATQILKTMQKESGEFNDEFDNTVCTTAMAAIILQSPLEKLPLFERNLEK